MVIKVVWWGSLLMGDVCIVGVGDAISKVMLMKVVVKKGY